jgi:hypothetical protein
LTRGTFHRVFNLARELGKRHEIDLFCLDDAQSETHQKVFAAFSKRIHFQPFKHPPWEQLLPKRLFDPAPATVSHRKDAAAVASLKAFASGEAYDLVHFCDLVMWPYVASLGGRHLRVMDRSRVELLFESEELANLKLGPKQKFLRWENLSKLRRRPVVSAMWRVPPRSVVIF